MVIAWDWSEMSMKSLFQRLSNSVHGNIIMSQHQCLFLFCPTLNELFWLLAPKLVLLAPNVEVPNMDELPAPPNVDELLNIPCEGAPN